MRVYIHPSAKNLGKADLKVMSDLMNEVLDAVEDWNAAAPFFFEYRNVTVMFAPDTHFFLDIPEAPLPHIGGYVDGDMILAALTAANDRLPALVEEDSLA